MTERNKTAQPAPLGQVERSVRHAAPKRHSVAMWGNLIVAQAWSAACYVRPGWFPAAVSLVSILIAALILYQDKITAAIAERAEDEHA